MMAGGKAKKVKVLPPWMLQRTPYHKQSRFKGPHVLLNIGHVIDPIVDKAGISSADIVLEINPGAGNLTAKLLEVGKSVIAVEMDPLLAQDLECRFKNSPLSHRLKVIQGNILNCDLPFFDICVANLPFDNCYPITFKLLSHRPLFRSAIILIPREFALRLNAKPNDSRHSPLSLNIQLLARVTHLTMVSKNNYSPPLKSDISLVRLEPKDPPFSLNLKEWYGLVRICFIRKKKTLGSVFKLKSVLSALEESNKSLRDVSQEKDIDIAAYISMLGNAFGDLSVEGDDVDEEMELECRDIKGSQFKNRVLGVLKEAGFEMTRCSQANTGRYFASPWFVS